MSQTVWIVEPTDYDQYGICGVYDSLEAAKASLPHVTTWVEVEGSWIADGPFYCISEQRVQTLAQEDRS